MLVGSAADPDRPSPLGVASKSELEAALGELGVEAAAVLELTDFWTCSAVAGGAGTGGELNRGLAVL